VDRLGEWSVVNAMKINRSYSKAVCFTRARVMDPLNYSLMDTLIAEGNSCKYLGIILRSDLSWADHVNYTVKKNWKALHFTMRIFRKGNSNTNTAYVSLVRPIVEYGAAWWDLCREGQINAIDRVQKKAAKYLHHKISPNWEPLASRRKVSRLCALYKAYDGERAWKDIGDSLKRPYYLSTVDHVRKIMTSWQRTDIGKYSFVNRTIGDWNQLPAEVLETLPVNQPLLEKG